MDLLEPWKKPASIEQAVTSAKAIDAAADRIVTARVLTGLSNDMKEGKMPLIEIKGLGAVVADVKKGMGELRQIAADVGTESAGLKAELTALKEQIQQHRADLRFEAETLGNGSGS